MVGSFVSAITSLEWPQSDKKDSFFSRTLLYEVDVFVALPCDGCIHILSYLVIAFLHTDSIKIIVRRQHAKRFSVKMSI